MVLTRVRVGSFCVAQNVCVVLSLLLPWLIASVLVVLQLVSNVLLWSLSLFVLLVCVC